MYGIDSVFFFFFQAEDGIRDYKVTGVQTCALPILYYKDGTEYIGDYHIHPTQGPMVGATHVKSAHPKLYYSDQLPLSVDSMDPTDKEFETYRNKERKRKFI